MNAPGSDDRSKPLPPHFLLLERVTASVLILVLVALGWMVLGAYWPEAVGWIKTEVQIITLLALLTSALLLVSVVALWHTRET